MNDSYSNGNGDEKAYDICRGDADSYGNGDGHGSGNGEGHGYGNKGIKVLMPYSGDVGYGDGYGDSYGHGDGSSDGAGEGNSYGNDESINDPNDIKMLIP